MPNRVTCNIYNMASSCVSAISDLNPEIAAGGEGEARAAIEG